jgi:hypothetical protein
MNEAPMTGLRRRVAPSGEVELVVTSASADARCQVGATAWSIFEVLALDAVLTEDGSLVADSSIREMAARQRIGKDRAAAAFAALRTAGWIELRQSRVAENARFASASYVVHGIADAAAKRRVAAKDNVVELNESESWTVSSCEAARRLFEDEDDNEVEDDLRGGWQ